MSDRVLNTLSSERERRGWSQSRMAEAAGITRQSYAAIESGGAVPSTEVALRLSRALGKPVEELFRLPGQPLGRERAVWAGTVAPTPGQGVRLTTIAGRRIAHPVGEAYRPATAADAVVEEVYVEKAAAAEAAVDEAYVEEVAREETAGEEAAGERAAGEEAAVADPRVEDASRRDADVTGASRPARGGWTTVAVRSLADRPPPSDLVVVGCDPAFGLVAEVLRRERGMQVTWSPRGSRAALRALARGEAHLAGTHLLDVPTDEWNGPFIRDLVPFSTTRLLFAAWEQGLVVRPSAPRPIEGVVDLSRRGIRLLNREEGSGSRMLLDEELRAAGVDPATLSGYQTRARGHEAVAEGVAAGSADAGVATRSVAAALGLGFVPLRTEAYELVIPDHFLDLPAVQALLDVLRRPAVRGQVEALPGYDGEGMGTRVG